MGLAIVGNVVVGVGEVEVEGGGCNVGCREVDAIGIVVVFEEEVALWWVVVDIDVGVAGRVVGWDLWMSVVVAVEEEEDCGLLSSVGRDWEVTRFHVLQLALP